MKLMGLDALLQRMNEAYHLDENISVQEHLDAIHLTTDANGRIKATARRLVETVRANRRKFGGLDSFLQEFGLSNRVNHELVDGAVRVIVAGSAVVAVIGHRIWGSVPYRDGPGNPEQAVTDLVIVVPDTGRARRRVVHERVELRGRLRGRGVAKVHEKHDDVLLPRGARAMGGPGSWRRARPSVGLAGEFRRLPGLRHHEMGAVVPGHRGRGSHRARLGHGRQEARERGGEGDRRQNKRTEAPHDFRSRE